MTGIPFDARKYYLDGDGHEEIFVKSPWGIGILKLSGSVLTAPVMAENGTNLGGWTLKYG